MPFLPKVKNDIFISYAHADNEPDVDGQEFVTLLIKQFKAIMKQRLSGMEPEVFWDTTHLGANREVETALISEVESSAVMVAIVSPAYQSREYTIAEMEAFLRKDTGADCLFLLEILPIEEGVNVHPTIERNKRFQFWHRTGAGEDVAMRIDPMMNKSDFMTRLTAFCIEVRDKLIELRGESAGDVPAAVAHKPPVGQVLLAQTTDDLDLEARQVRAYLQQYDIEVFPSEDYPQGGEDFRAAFAQDLDRSDLVVQLLGRSAGRMPVDMPTGYMAYQCEAAKAAGKPLACWRHPELDLADVAHDAHRALLSSSDVMTIGLEAFKSHVVDLLQRQVAPPRPVRSALVYIGAERSDMDLALELFKAFSNRGLPVAVPFYDGSPEEVRQDLEESLIDSDKVIFLHGAAPATWVRGFLRRLGQSQARRDGPHDRTAMIKAPPPKQSGVNQTFPNLEVIDCSDGLDVDEVLEKMEAWL